MACLRPALGGLVTLLAGCFADFPTYAGGAGATPEDGTLGEGDGGAGGGGSGDGGRVAVVDAGGGTGPGAQDQGTAARADAEPDQGRRPADAEVTPEDARVEDVEPTVDATLPEGPHAALRIEGGATPVGCGAHDIGLVWETFRVSRCDLRTVPPVFSLDDLPLPRARVEVDGVLGQVEFILECTTADGTPLRAGATLRPLTGLPPALELADRHAVRAEQRRCASAKGQTLVRESDGEGFVYGNAASANQSCRCLGYGPAQRFDPHEEDGEQRCFGAPDNNTVGDWRADGVDGQWFNEPAENRNDCIGRLRCTGPVDFCADRYAP